MAQDILRQLGQVGKTGASAPFPKCPDSHRFHERDARTRSGAGTHFLVVADSAHELNGGFPKSFWDRDIRRRPPEGEHVLFVEDARLPLQGGKAFVMIRRACDPLLSGLPGVADVVT